MSVFFYRACDPQGMIVSGRLEAERSDDLKKILAGQGLIPLQVQSRQQSSHFSLSDLLPKRVDAQEVLILTRQFYTLFKAGVGMETILVTLSKQCQNKRMNEALQKIRSDIIAGENLSKAFSHHIQFFGELYINMLVAGEEAGILEQVLKNLGDLYEKEISTKSAVKSATLYPKIVIFVLVGAATLMMTTVVPKFASFFAHYKAELPLPTKMLMVSSHFFANYWWVIGLTLFVLIYGFRKYARTTRGKIRLGKLQFKVPVFGPLNLRIVNSRFCHILAALYRSGLSMTRCLEITGGTIENGAFTRELEILKSEITGGKTVSEGMRQCHYFLPVVVEATAVGEKSGSLDEMLEGMGTHYDMEVQHMVKNLTTLLEPFLLFFIFGMVTLFALAIFLPIWNMSKAVSGH